MLMTYSFIVVVLCSPTVNVQTPNVTIIVPWWGTLETNGPTMGSSFMIAVKRLNYTKAFAVMPLRCDDQFSVTSQVHTCCICLT